MPWNVVGFLSMVWLGMTLLNRIAEGWFAASVDTAVINKFLIFKQISLFGVATIPVPNIDYFMTGIPSLVTWDYSFFSGDAVMVQYFLYSLTAAVSFGLFLVIIGLLVNYLVRR